MSTASPISTKAAAAAFAGAIGILLFAGSASAIPMIPKPTMPTRIEPAQTIIIIRHRHGWRQERRWYRRWQRHNSWRAHRYWNGPLYFDEPRYAMYPPAEDIAPPRKKLQAVKPRKVAKRSQPKAKTLIGETQSAAKAMTAKTAAASSRLMSCDAAAHVIAGYAFSNVKPVNCAGATYKFRATRQDRAYLVTLNANDGNLVEVAKQP